MTTDLRPVLVGEDEAAKYFNTGPVDLIERCLTNFTSGMHAADELTLHHEAERLESLPTSPAVTRMRAIVAAEQGTRRLRPPATPHHGAGAGQGKSRLADVLAVTAASAAPATRDAA